MFFIATTNWVLIFSPWPNLIRSPKTGIETAILHGSDKNKINDLQSRLRYIIHLGKAEGVVKQKRKKK